MKASLCIILLSLLAALHPAQGFSSDFGDQVSQGSPSELQGITCDAQDYAGRNLYKTAEWTVIFDGEGSTSLVEKSLVEKTIDESNLFTTVEVFATGRVIQAKDLSQLQLSREILTQIEQIGGTYIECVRVPQRAIPLH